MLVLNKIKKHVLILTMSLAGTNWRDLTPEQLLWRHFIDISRLSSILPDVINRMRNDTIVGSYDDNRWCHGEFLPPYMRALRLRLDKLRSVLFCEERFRMGEALLRQVEAYDDAKVIAAGTDDDADVGSLDYDNRNVVEAADLARALYAVSLELFGAEDDVIEEVTEIYGLLYPGLGVVQDQDELEDKYESFMLEKDEIVKKLEKEDGRFDVYDEDDAPESIWMASDYPDAVTAYFNKLADEGMHLTSFSNVDERFYPGLPVSALAARPNRLPNRYESHRLPEAADASDSDSEYDSDETDPNLYSGLSKRRRGERKMTAAAKHRSQSTKKVVRRVPARKVPARK